MCFPTLQHASIIIKRRIKASRAKTKRNTQRKRRQKIKTESTEKAKEAGWNGMAQRMTRTNSYKKMEKRRTKSKTNKCVQD